MDTHHARQERVGMPCAAAARAIVFFAVLSGISVVHISCSGLDVLAIVKFHAGSHALKELDPVAQQTDRGAMHVQHNGVSVTLYRLSFFWTGASSWWRDMTSYLEVVNNSDTPLVLDANTVQINVQAVRPRRVHRQMDELPVLSPSVTPISHEIPSGSEHIIPPKGRRKFELYVRGFDRPVYSVHEAEVRLELQSESTDEPWVYLFDAR